MKAEIFYKDKTVIITGGSKGIGRETARLLGAKGARIVITGRDQVAIDKTVSELQAKSITILGIQGDVTSLDDCTHVVKRTLEEFGEIDILINNAGMSMRGLFEHTSPDLFNKIIAINFLGAAQMTSAALPSLLKTHGHIVFVSSLSGLKGLPGIAPYSAAKMALKSLSESLRCELAPKGVHIGTVYVSFTENDPGKYIYDASGEALPLDRTKNSSTQLEVAQAISTVIVRRKRQLVMTPLGKLANFSYTVFPGLSERLITKFGLKSSLYATDSFSQSPEQ